jgi:hypothetical protein
VNSGAFRRADTGSERSGIQRCKHGSGILVDDSQQSASRSFWGSPVVSSFSRRHSPSRNTSPPRGPKSATSKPDGDLVWTGVSDSFNPNSAKKGADGLVKEVQKQMEKDGLLPKASASN